MKYGRRGGHVTVTLAMVLSAVALLPPTLVVAMRAS